MHGTDTMAYTASALSFMLENLGKTVIVTGSQVRNGHMTSPDHGTDEYIEWTLAVSGYGQNIKLKISTLKIWNANYRSVIIPRAKY